MAKMLGFTNVWIVVLDAVKFGNLTLYALIMLTISAKTATATVLLHFSYKYILHVVNEYFGGNIGNKPSKFYNVFHRMFWHVSCFGWCITYMMY